MFGGINYSQYLINFASWSIFAAPHFLFMEIIPESELNLCLPFPYHLFPLNVRTALPSGKPASSVSFFLCKCDKTSSMCASSAMLNFESPPIFHFPHFRWLLPVCCGSGTELEGERDSWLTSILNLSLKLSYCNI